GFTHIDLQPARAGVERCIAKVELHGEEATVDRDRRNRELTSRLRAAALGIKQSKAEVVRTIGRLAGAAELALVGELRFGVGAGAPNAAEQKRCDQAMDDLHG